MEKPCPVSIIDTEKAKNSAKLLGSYTLYTVRYISNGTWINKRRFSEFDHLRSLLQQSNPSIFDTEPHFPSRKFLKSTNSSEVQKRKDSLNSWLVWAAENFKNDPNLISFLTTGSLAGYEAPRSLGSQVMKATKRSFQKKKNTPSLEESRVPSSPSGSQKHDSTSPQQSPSTQSTSSSLEIRTNSNQNSQNEGSNFSGPSSPLSDSDFQSLLHRVNESVFSKSSPILEVASSYSFSIQQLAKLLQTFNFSIDQFDLLSQLNFRIQNPTENQNLITNLFQLSQDKTKAKQILDSMNPAFES